MMKPGVKNARDGVLEVTGLTKGFEVSSTDR